MLLEELVSVSSAVAGTSARRAKVALLADALRRLRPEEVPVAVAYLSGEIPGGTVGVGWASLRDPPPPAPRPSLELRDVQASLERIRGAAGRGSQAARRQALHDLLGRATQAERRFLVGLLLGEIRQGALEGVMVEAVAAAAGLPAGEVRRALMLAGELGAVAGAALAPGGAGLTPFRLVPLRPVKPMLAQTAEDLEDALGRASPAAVEWKLDGARLQVHRDGGEIRAFTRTLADVSSRVPEIVRAVAGLPVRSVVLDGEAIALRPDGRPRPFQETMRRFGSRLDVDRLADALPLTVAFFDCLHLDGEDLIDRPLRERSVALAERVPGELRVPRREAAGPEAARAVLEEALARGHEGVMVKALGSPYEAGRRGAAWLKVKRARTLDLVVLAAEWGHGRRRGWLSNLHLGARDPRTGGFVMLGKTFKGLTDEMLRWQTDELLRRATAREGITVHVRPELVVEVAYDGVQASPRYPGGVALRFARVKGYRPDKRPEEADTIDAVRAVLGPGP
ncbi:MAG TPA: ATP-dependent DNA ligase [Actinomycetota bacterium]|nr:ATP-dependent DNA ligase [Actinomycetota bacterium]